MAGERRSISTIHAYWETPSSVHPEGYWSIETHHADGDVVQDSRQDGWDGPAPHRYQRQDAETLRSALQTWEPEARVMMHEAGRQAGGGHAVRVW
jgi:hypothetical protein